MPEVLELGYTYNVVRSISFLDYIFNGCSMLSLDVSLDQKQYETIIAAGGSDPVLVNLNWRDIYITGQVVSYTGTKVTAAGAYEASLCLMPYGAVDYLQKPELSVNAFSSRSIPTVQGRSLVPKQLSSSVLFRDEEITVNPKSTDSVMASFMTWRRAYAQSGFKAMRKKADSWKYSSSKHRLVYLAFSGGKSSYGTSSPLSSTPVLWGDYDFAKLALAGGNFLPDIKSGTDLQVSFTSGRQALLNSAFSYIPSASSLFQDISGQLINETFEVTIAGRFPMKFPSFAFGESSRTFTVGKVNSGSIDFKGLWAPPPWKPDDPVVHLRTLYTYSDDGTAGDTGHIAKFLFGRFNPKLFTA